MNAQIASTVELLQRRPITSVREATPHGYPDPFALFVLFQQSKSVPSGVSEREEADHSAPFAARVLTVTQGNVNNHHIYLTPVMDLFPDDAMGGENKRHMGAKTVRVHWGDEMVETDIVRGKHMFRRRGWVRRFFEQNRITAGDSVLLEQLSGYEYRLSKVQK